MISLLRQYYLSFPKARSIRGLIAWLKIMLFWVFPQTNGMYTRLSWNMIFLLIRISWRYVLIMLQMEMNITGLALLEYKR